jgi:uncharacterized phage protein (TIGR02216 family)
MRARFPWDDFMRLGLGTLRLSPRDFWAASPREIVAALPRAKRAGLGRDGLFALMQRFPDEA